MRPLPGLFSVLLLLGLLAGCGQKGPLYLPGDAEATKQYDPAGEHDGSDTHTPHNDDAHTPRGGEG